MTSLALVVGVVLVAQLPLLPLPSELEVVAGRVFVASLALSVAAIYLSDAGSAAGTRAGWRRGSQPAEALHYE